MPKPMYVWTGTAWVSVASEVESLATYATQSYADNSSNVAAGLKPIVPTSVAIGSGSSSVSTLGQVTFTGASSVSLNGVFSSAYQNYRILFLTTSIATSGNVSLKMRTSGTDNSDAQYQRQQIFAGSTTVNATRSTGQTSFLFGALAVGSYLNTINIDVFKPFDAANTGWVGQVASALDSTGPEVWVQYGGHNVATSYDGITFISGGTFTGTVSVYGYKK